MAPDSRPAWTWPLHPASWPRRISDLPWPGAKVGGALLAFGGLVLGSAGTVAVASLHSPQATAGRASAGTVPGSSAYGLISRAAPPSDSARAVPHEAAAPPTSVVIPRLCIRS